MSANAFFQALCLYLALCFAIVHALVAYKWRQESKDAVGTGYIVEHIINPEIPQELEQWTALNDVDDMDNLLRQIKALPTTQGTNGIVGRTMELLEDASMELDNNGSPPKRPPSSLLKLGNRTLQTLRLHNLLSYNSLSSLKEVGMKILVDSSVDELQSIVKEAHSVKWHVVVHGILHISEKYPKKEALTLESLQEELCQLPIMEENEEEEEEEEEEEYYVADDEEEDEEDMYALETDLVEQFNAFQLLLDQRVGRSQLQNHSRLSKATQQLEQEFTYASDILTAAVDETYDNLQEIAAEVQSAAELRCPANQQNIRALVEAGLAALARHEDTRPALLEALKHLDPELEVEELELEWEEAAELDAAGPPQTPRPEQVPALRLLDSPLLCRLAVFVDQLLDHLGGHIDPLDQYVDQLAERLVDANNEDASTLGKVFVASLLVQSGHWQVPVPLLLRKQLETTRRGRDVLATLS